MCSLTKAAACSTVAPDSKAAFNFNTCSRATPILAYSSGVKPSASHCRIE